MTLVELRNSYHGTSVRVRRFRAEDDAAETWYRIQHGALSDARTPAGVRRYRRICASLCGCGRCECGVVRPQ
jgi:hypothetical protein